MKNGDVDEKQGYVEEKYGYIDVKQGYVDEKQRYVDVQQGYVDKKQGYVDVKSQSDIWFIAAYFEFFSEFKKFKNEFPMDYLHWRFPNFYTRTLKKEESGFSKTWVLIYQSTGCNYLEFKIAQIYVG